jgi:hypothetical protein
MDFLLFCYSDRADQAFWPTSTMGWCGPTGAGPLGVTGCDQRPCARALVEPTKAGWSALLVRELSRERLASLDNLSRAGVARLCQVHLALSGQIGTCRASSS